MLLFSGGIYVLVNGTNYTQYDTLNATSVEAGVNAVLRKPSPKCLEVSYPSGMGISFCEEKGALSFSLTTIPQFENRTRGLLGDWNGAADDDFTLQNGTVLNPSASDFDIHFEFGLSCKYRV